MNLEYFPHFIRANYKAIDASNEELNAIGILFKEYLQKKFEGEEDKLDAIWAIDPTDVILNMGHPFKVNGYHPALVIHFSDFCKNRVTEAQLKEQIKNEYPK